MRVLKSTKPIPVSYLKAGKDHGLYDQEKLIWLPGRITPVRAADTRLLRHNVGPTVGSGGTRGSPAPKALAGRKLSTTPNGPGLWIAVPKRYMPGTLVVAKR